MFETFSWEEAYNKKEFKFPWKIAEFISNGNRREQIDSISNNQYKLIEKCWNQNPDERLKINEIIEELELLLNDK